jgi:hypothetical protein
MTEDSDEPTIRYDFGTFDGQCWPMECFVLDEPVPVSEILDWNEIDRGEAAFWPTGDRPEMTLLFEEHGWHASKQTLLALSALFDGLGGDTTENFLRVRHAWVTLGICLSALTPTMVAALVVHIAVADDAATARRTVEAELRTRYGFNAEGGLLKHLDDSADWQIREFSFGGKAALVVAPRGKDLNPCD